MPRPPKGEQRPTYVNARAVMMAKIVTGEVEEARENDGKDPVCFSTQAGPLNSVSPTWAW